MRFAEKRKHHQRTNIYQTPTQRTSGEVDFPYGCSHLTQGTVWTRRSGPAFPTPSLVVATCICSIHEPKKQPNRLVDGILVLIFPLLLEADMPSLQQYFLPLTRAVMLTQQLGPWKARSCLTHDHLAGAEGSHNRSALLQGCKGPAAFHYPPLLDSQGQNSALHKSQPLP